mmetsp:Transcript_25871/g.65490  ORF Transcript_25871/g.65490 Transcript_25871/m.65490 type:complete len:176 (+) Transcript_25871:4804-5331(+)
MRMLACYFVYFSLIFHLFLTHLLTKAPTRSHIRFQSPSELHNAVTLLVTCYPHFVLSCLSLCTGLHSIIVSYRLSSHLLHLHIPHPRAHTHTALYAFAKGVMPGTYTSGAFGLPFTGMCSSFVTRSGPSRGPVCRCVAGLDVGWSTHFPLSFCTGSISSAPNSLPIFERSSDAWQ